VSASLLSLDKYLANPRVREVLVNAGRDVWVETDGRLEHVGTLPIGDVERIIERIVLPLARRVDRATPIVDARLPDGSRVCIMVPPVAVDGPAIAIRRFAVRDVPLDFFGPTSLVEVLREIVVSRCNVVVSGAASSGKTTLLNAMCRHVAHNDRIVTIEDVAELRLTSRHVLRLEAIPASPEGRSAIGADELVRGALRLRPDRFVVGEVRGDEVLDMLAAMNTGHHGSFTTCHANSPRDAVRRLETLALAAAAHWPLESLRDHLAAAIDVVVHVERTPAGRRMVTEVVELPLRGDGQPRPLWTPDVRAELQRQRC